MKLFLSYHFDADRPHHEHFVLLVSYYLHRQKEIEVYCYADDPGRLNWRRWVGRNAARCDAFILFAGEALGDVQRAETMTYLASARRPKCMVLVQLPGYHERTLPPEMFEFVLRVESGEISPEAPAAAAYPCAEAIAGRILQGPPNSPQRWWAGADGLPLGYPYDYEKAVIDTYADGQGRLSLPAYIEQGCPLRWPQVRREGDPENFHANPVDPNSIGRHRADQQRVNVDARMLRHDHNPLQDASAEPKRAEHGLTLPEAGPRARLRYPLEGELTVAVVVSGGIAPGINAVINGIVERHVRYWRDSTRGGLTYDLQMILFKNGFSGLLTGDLRYVHYENRSHLRIPSIDAGQLRHEATKGGSIIGTSRHDSLLDPLKRSQRLEDIVVSLSGHGVDILYVIGGDGSMRAAHAIWTRAKELQRSRRGLRPLSVAAIPKTMDNDILWVWQSFGFLSAVERAKESVLQLHTEVMSNPRLCVIQLFGSDSGFVVSHTALASGVADAALIPEVSFTLHGLSQHVRTRLAERRAHGDSLGGLVLLGETAIPRDVEDYIDNSDYTIGLEGIERDAVCSFVRSSLLISADVLDWSDFFRRLSEQHDVDEVLGRLWLRLPSEVRGLIEEGWDSLRDKESVQRLVLKALSSVIRARDAFDGLCADHPSVKSLRLLLSAVDDILSSDDTAGALAAADPARAHDHLKDLLATVDTPTNHDAKELLFELAIGDINGPTRAREISRLTRRLVEMINRYVIDASLSSELRSVESRPSFHRDRRVHGQTPDELRRGGLKIIANVLQADIRNPAFLPGAYWHDYRVFTNEPRQLLRAIPPSVTDVIFGHRLGTLAVDNAMAGYTDFMVSQWLTEYVLVPLELVVLGRKRVRRDGIFWKSVLANTGQPPSM